jgi:succinylarginine dihydrolase
VGPRVFYDEALHRDLEAWVKKHYRDRLAPDDLRDPALAREGMVALDVLTQLLALGSVYDFQKS